MPKDDQQLLEWLQEDIGAEEADDFLPLARQLRHLPAPLPMLDSAALARQMMPPRRTRWQALTEWAEWPPLLLLRSQIRIVQREIWLASALILVLGGLVTVLWELDGNSQQLPLSVIAPMVAAVGVALLYDREESDPTELEAAWPIPPALLLLARLTLLYGFDLGISLLCTIGLILTHSDLSLWPLLQTWLLPMTFLSSLAFFLSIYSRNIVFSITLCLVLWSLHLLFTNHSTHSLWAYILSMPGMMHPSLLGACAALLAASLWLIANPEQRLGAAS